MPFNCIFWCKIDDCGQTTNFRCRRLMPFNFIFYCGSFDIYHSGLAWSVLFFVTVYIVKISTVHKRKTDLLSYNLTNYSQGIRKGRKSISEKEGGGMPLANIRPIVKIKWAVSFLSPWEMMLSCRLSAKCVQEHGMLQHSIAIIHTYVLFTGSAHN